jgi:ABC-type nitrate/sulfonate/bicarbonate transport system permease component
MSEPNVPPAPASTPAEPDAGSGRIDGRSPAADADSRSERTLLAAARERSRVRRLRRRDLLLAILTPVALLALWEIAARTNAIDSRLFPAPSRIFARAVDMVGSGPLLDDLGATVGRLLVGLVLGAVAGVVVGLAMGSWRPLNAALGPLFTALYALPKIAILPLLLLIFGLTETPRILAVGISVFFVLQINTLAGVRQIDAKVLEAAQAYGAAGLRRFRFVILPGALPFIFSGLRVSAGMAVIVVTSVEFVASNSGLGYLIWNSWQLFQPEQMYVGLVVVSLLGAVMTGLFILAEKLAVPWKRNAGPSTTRSRKG